jgi:uncharacterized protein (TIGR02444 family)
VTQDAHNATILADNPFWRYSASVYRKDNCADFLLRAQNNLKLDINVLLFIGWLAQQKKLFIVTPQHSTLITGFQKDITERIRYLRIKGKGFNSSEFYKALLDLELHAEYHQQARLVSLKELMPSVDLNIQDIIRKGVYNYIQFEQGLKELSIDEQKLNQQELGELRLGIFEEDNNWLQTLIEHLQPVSK